MEDKICSPEKCSMKSSYEKLYLTWMKKNIYDKNFSYWTQVCFDWIKMYLDIMKKSWYNENIFHWIQIYFDWVKIYFNIMKKDDIMKTHFIKYKVILIEWKYIFISCELSFLQHFNNHTRIRIINTFLMKSLCFTLKIVLFKWLGHWKTNNGLDFDRFKVTFDEITQRHAPIKKLVYSS